LSKSVTLPIRFVPEIAPRYEIIYPKEGAAQSEIYQVVLIKTEPGTTANRERYQAGRDGILAIPTVFCPNQYKIELDLTYPDQTTEHILKEVKKNLLMVLTIGSNQIKINDDIKTIEAPPYIKNGRTMVPVRIIAEAFCCIVTFDPLSRIITIRSQEKSITLFIGYDMVMVNGKEIKLDAPPEIKNGRTFLPLRFIVEVFGAKIDWNAKLGEIQIRM
jgi:hypothetical protein